MSIERIKNYRAAYCHALVNTQSLAVEMVRLLGIKYHPEKVMVISIGNDTALVLKASEHYLKVVEATAIKDTKKVKLSYIVSHDSGWKEGIEQYFAKLHELGAETLKLIFSL